MKYSVHLTRENKYFKHGIQVFEILDFHSARQWLSEAYGQSESVDRDVKYNDHWAFYIKYNSYMLYVRGDEELSWFKIKYGEEVE
jgi:hypothetical protein